MEIFGKVKTKTSNDNTSFFKILDVVKEVLENERKYWGKPFLAFLDTVYFLL